MRMLQYEPEAHDIRGKRMTTDQTPIVEARGLEKRYGKNLAVKGIDLAIYPGEIVGILGPNGAGKTTTIKMLVGLLRPTAGTVLIGGYDMQKQAIEAKRIIGYAPDLPYVPEKLSAREFLQFISGLYQVEADVAAQRSEELLRLFGLTERADQLLGDYSHGMRQKVILAASMLHNPRAIFLDEPTVGLDPRSARLIKDILRGVAKRGAAVMMSTHILEIAEHMCDRIVIIDRGSILAQGTMQELRDGGGIGSLEDIFLNLTGGPSEAAIVEALG